MVLSTACEGGEKDPSARPQVVLSDSGVTVNAASPSDELPMGQAGENAWPVLDGGGTDVGLDGSDGGALDPNSSKWPQCFESFTLIDDPKLTVNPTWSPVAKTYTHGYLAMHVGPKSDACLTEAVIQRDLVQLNEGFKDVVNLLGFPAFPDWKKGHQFNWYILNSGLPGDTTKPTDMGGGPGNRSGVPDFESTKDCPCKDDPNRPGEWDGYQAGGALHESIHAFQIVLDKYNNPGSGWFHEAHDVYLTTMRLKLRGEPVQIGWLVPAMLFAEHIPIESMGFYTDGTVSGPSDQGGKDSQGNLRVMPEFYGGIRYGLEAFPLSLALQFGRGFVNCLWEMPEAGNKGSVFKVLESIAGVEAVREAVLNFGSRNSLLDYAEWSEPLTKEVKSAWNNPPITKFGRFFYTFPTAGDDGYLHPPARQIPHHQGRNIVPIQVAEGAAAVTVELVPDEEGSLGTPLEMRARFTYRDSKGAPVYGEPFASGRATIELPNGVRNGFVNLVIAVVNPFNPKSPTGYGFDQNETFNYKVRIVSGGTIAPTTTVPW